MERNEEDDLLSLSRIKQRGSSADKRKKPIYQMLPVYANAVLMGDSMAESILDYRLLRKRNVIAKRGTCIDMIDAEFQEVFALEPAHLFLEFGKNDILHFQRDEKRFIHSYRKTVAKIRKNLPQTKIYVNSIIPMHSRQLSIIGGIAVLNDFNNALQEMCQALSLTYIDNDHLIPFCDEVFEFDGIHPKYPYYIEWLKNMAKVAGLQPSNDGND